MAIVNFRMVGYARVSTQIQETTLQLDALAAAGVGKIYEEKASGASVERRFVLKKLLEEIQPGQTLVVYKIDRIARSLKDLLRILSLLAEKGATIKSLTEPLDTTSSMGMFVIQILGAVAELKDRSFESVPWPGKLQLVLEVRFLAEDAFFYWMKKQHL